LAVPDWPTTFGYNMFLYPWSKMIGGIFYEHSHRLIASSVGMITIALTWTFWVKEQRLWLRYLAVVALGLVIVQGLLGGLRVVLLQQTLAIIHACAAQAFFALAVSLALFSSAEWRAPVVGKPIVDGGRLRRLATVTTVLIYLQIAFGAVLRHTGERIDAHLLFAALVVLHVVLLLTRTLRLHAGDAKLLRPAYLLTGLLALQTLLGVASYLSKFTVMLRWPYEVVVLTTTTHLIVGALMLAASLVFTLRAYRRSASTFDSLETEVLREQFSL